MVAVLIELLKRLITRCGQVHFCPIDHFVKVVDRYVVSVNGVAKSQQGRMTREFLPHDQVEHLTSLEKLLVFLLGVAFIVADVIAKAHECIDCRQSPSLPWWQKPKASIEVTAASDTVAVAIGEVKTRRGAILHGLIPPIRRFGSTTNTGRVAADPSICSASDAGGTHRSQPVRSSPRSLDHNVQTVQCRALAPD